MAVDVNGTTTIVSVGTDANGIISLIVIAAIVMFFYWLFTGNKEEKVERRINKTIRRLDGLYEDFDEVKEWDEDEYEEELDDLKRIAKKLIKEVDDLKESDQKNEAKKYLKRFLKTVRECEGDRKKMTKEIIKHLKIDLARVVKAIEAYEEEN